MSTRVTCRCGQAFAASADLAGKTVPCPFCGAPIGIPNPDRIRAVASPAAAPNRWMFALCGAAGAAVLLLGLAILVRTMLVSSPRDPQTAPRGPAGSPRAIANAPATSSAVETPPEPVVSRPAEQSSAGSSEARSASLPGGVFSIGGVYELRVPGAEPIDGYERTSTAGLAISGGARLPNNVSAAEVRSRVAEFRAGNTASLGDVTVSWALIVKPEPKEPAPPRNPAARPIVVNGLSGIEVNGPGAQRHWAFGFTDHSLLISVRGPQERIDSAEVRSILHSLRRIREVPPELAEQARTAR